MCGAPVGIIAAGAKVISGAADVVGIMSESLHVVSDGLRNNFSRKTMMKVIGNTLLKVEHYLIDKTLDKAKAALSSIGKGVTELIEIGKNKITDNAFDYGIKHINNEKK